MSEENKERIRQKLITLSNDPNHGEKLKMCDFRKVRFGDYRAIYEIDHDNGRVIILFIGHRKGVYDDFSRLF